MLIFNKRIEPTIPRKVDHDLVPVSIRSIAKKIAEDAKNNGFPELDPRIIWDIIYSFDMEISKKIEEGKSFKVSYVGSFEVKPKKEKKKG